ncbi:MAG: glycosyltransferase family 4 protein [Armatimonadetes bacterium]|nr:glycosyltransferase family 4 protein [Armatimonadota bacterium]
MNPLILSSTPDAPVAPDAPRADFRLLAESLGGTVLSAPKPNDSLLSRIEKHTAADLRQSIAALRQRRTVSVYVSLSEKVGVPLAFLLPKGRHGRPAHVLIAHHLTSSNKRVLQKRTGYLSRFDRIIALGTSQEQYLTECGYAGLITRVRHAVDARFWTPQMPANGGYLLAVGRERRDYQTLATALRELPDLSCVVVASSPWSRQGDAANTGDAPANMTFRKGLSYPALRELYAGASLVVVPLETGTAYAAGATGCLESMAMAKPTITTATPGLTDYLTSDADEPLAQTVRGGDPAALAASIRALLADAPERERLTHAGRQFVETSANVDDYVSKIAVVVRGAV